MDEPLILDDLAVFSGARRLLQLSLTVRPGQVVTVMGPSGSGKSSLLAAITGTLPAGMRATGQVLLGKMNLGALPPERRRIGILFQDDLLFPHLSVGGNLAFGLAQGGSRAERRARVDAALADIGLAGFADRDPATLSGGEKARVALMRTLLSEPCALLLDEPFAKLDQSLRAQVRQLVFDRARGLPVILVTHDPADADAAGGPVVTIGG